MSENEALKKAAEEITKGLAKDEPLVATEMSRKNTGAAVRRDAFQIIIDALDNAEEYTAMLKIVRGWKRRDNPGLRAMDLHRIPGSPSTIDQKTNLDEEFDTWWNYMTINKMIHYRSAVIDTCCLGKNLTEAAWATGVDKATIKNRAVLGIREFLIANKR